MLINNFNNDVIVDKQTQYKTIPEYYLLCINIRVKLVNNCLY